MINKPICDIVSLLDIYFSTSHMLYSGFSLKEVVYTVTINLGSSSLFLQDFLSAMGHILWIMYGPV